MKKNINYLISEKFTKRHIFLTDFLSALANTKTGLFGAFVVLLMFFLAIFAPWIAPYDPTLIDVPNRLQPPNLSHWMGTDLAGRDVLSRLMWGARPSLQVGVLAVLIGMPGGIIIGLIAGFYRGSLLETILMRATEIIAAVPLLIVAVAVVGILGVNPIDLGFFTISNEIKIVFVLGILYIPGLARVVFAVASTEAVSDYIRARKTQGVRDFSLIFGDVLPNCLSVVTVWATLLTAGGVLAEAGLSFVGLGVQPPDASWGVMLSEARKFIFSGEWWLLFFPGLAISITVIGFNLFGDALRDILDPRHYTGPRID
jgi:peptide/nickel transport system permease protein